jgi:heme a synthase
VFLAIMTLLLIVLGAMVTSNQAGLSVPDWPTSFGSLYKIPPMINGVQYEHGHRMFAEFVGLLIIVIAVWAQRVEQRGWMKALGWIALGSTIGQGVLGGLTVLHGLPWLISTAHATLAQTIFCVLTAMALFTSKGWLQEVQPILESGPSLSTPALTAVAAAGVWVQLILGAAFRHTGIRLLPHLIGACIVTALLCWMVVRILTRYNAVAHLRRPAQLILAMLLLQLGLGFAAYVTRLTWILNPSQPTIWIVSSTVAHVTGGAIVLAAVVVLAIQVRRTIRFGGQESVMVSTSRKAVAA